jgi:hypothetical protein
MSNSALFRRRRAVTSGHGVHEAMLAIQTQVTALVAPKVVVAGSYRSSELNQGGALLCARENIHSVTLLATVWAAVTRLCRRQVQFQTAVEDSR